MEEVKKRNTTSLPQFQRTVFKVFYDCRYDSVRKDKRVLGFMEETGTSPEQTRIKSVKGSLVKRKRHKMKWVKKCQKEVPCLSATLTISRRLWKRVVIGIRPTCTSWMRSGLILMTLSLVTPLSLLTMEFLVLINLGKSSHTLRSCWKKKRRWRCVITFTTSTKVKYFRGISGHEENKDSLSLVVRQ